MPAFCGERFVRLLLLLALCAPGGSPADLPMTTQDASQTKANLLTQMPTGHNESSPEPVATTRIVNRQTRESISDYSSVGHGVSTSGPDLTTQDFKQATEEKSSNFTYAVYEIILSGVSSTSVEKNITLDSPAKVELSCSLARKYPHLKIVQVDWKRGNETIKHINKSENSWSIQLTVTDENELGSYSCILKSEEEFKAVFHLQVPKIEGKEKPIISYEGDSVVMICKSSNYTPITWTWYLTNGSKQITINDSLLSDKYIIDQVPGNTTHLKILKLNKKDDGAYWCEAVFKLGKSKGKLNLKVLTFMVPLKPFLAILAEVIILVAVIFLYEMYSKKKEKHTEDEKEFEQVEQLKSEESNGVESSSTRHRKV
ncbi:embigin [Rhea pennata]|uniref:embigin n=1 Tax=Rhea pennata TaxID=8795 RepID=UPI002E26860E